MNDKNPSVLKLSNGEDIICHVIDASKDKITIQDPLLIEVHSRVTEKGVTETLSLTRWLQPFTDEGDYKIEKHSIVITVPSSDGLTKYYNHVIDNIGDSFIKEPTDKELNEIEREEIEELIEELDNATIH